MILKPNVNKQKEQERNALNNNNRVFIFPALKTETSGPLWEVSEFKGTVIRCSYLFWSHMNNIFTVKSTLGLYAYYFIFLLQHYDQRLD